MKRTIFLLFGVATVFGFAGWGTASLRNAYHAYQDSINAEKERLVRLTEEANAKKIADAKSKEIAMYLAELLHDVSHGEVILSPEMDVSLWSNRFGGIDDLAEILNDAEYRQTGPMYSEGFFPVCYFYRERTEVLEFAAFDSRVWIASKRFTGEFIIGEKKVTEVLALIREENPGHIRF